MNYFTTRKQFLFSSFELNIKEQQIIKNSHHNKQMAASIKLNKLQSHLNSLKFILSHFLPLFPLYPL